MHATEVLSRLQLLSSAPKQDRIHLANELQSILGGVESSELGELLSLCENVLQPRGAARAATRFLLKACKGRDGFRLEGLLRSGISLPTLLQLARQTRLADLPPSAPLADELLALVLAWEPLQGAAGGEAAPLATVLGAVRYFGLVGHLQAETAEVVLQHAIGLQGSTAAAGARRFTLRAVAEAGEVLPEWRPLVLRMLLAPDLASAVAPSEVVRVAQDWGLHDDPTVFAQLRRLLESPRRSPPASAPEEAIAGIRCERDAPSKTHLPKLTLSEENVVLVDGLKSQDVLSAATETAIAAAAKGQMLLVGLDAEWEDPRPLSLLQLAVSVDGESTTVFLVDMLTPPSPITLECCRRLLRGSPKGGHEVLTFSAREDRRRLAVTGILPELAHRSDLSSDDTETRTDAGEANGWVDLQQSVWGLGPQPSLQAVVKKALGAHMDKRLQKSNWDERPLSKEQLDYAALDASVLLKLWKCWRGLPQGETVGPGDCSKEALTHEEEKARWQRRREVLAQKAVGAPRAADGGKKSINGDLRFVIVTALTKLARKMRGLGLDSVILGENGKATQQDFREAVEDGRIVLTRSRKLKLPATVSEHTYVLRSEGTDEQLREVIDIFGVEVHADCLCGRCVQCNSWDWRFASRSDIRGNPQVSEKTLRSYDEFWVCGGCGKVFWEGSMFEKAVGHFRTFMPDSGEGGPSSGEAPPSEMPAAASTPAGAPAQEASGCGAHRGRARVDRGGAALPGGPVSAARMAGAGSRRATAAFFQAMFAHGVSAGLDATEAAVSAMRKVPSGSCSF
mmetsp:Transcript_99021/g.288793  ORF Transcript_99021/g.288793 Transcript_99021/m.288793 type:complete len:794 (-) Transcript_99021:309-2690(-)